MKTSPTQLKTAIMDLLKSSPEVKISPLYLPAVSSLEVDGLVESRKEGEFIIVRKLN